MYVRMITHIVKKKQLFDINYKWLNIHLSHTQICNTKHPYKLCDK